MALEPIDERHALQIQAGILGRRAGHTFEDRLTAQINSFQYPVRLELPCDGHVFRGEPASILLRYLGARLGIQEVLHASAIATGALATSEEGKRWLAINGSTVSRCKSDIVLTLQSRNRTVATLGISTKSCNNRMPTNAQLFFTTARGFVGLLRASDIAVTEKALNALRQFCGDPGFRPSDQPAQSAARVVDPRRFFWEEINREGREQWEEIFHLHQDAISRLLFQKAYIHDPFVPEFLLHKTKQSTTWEDTEVAVFSIEELIILSRRYKRFETRPYTVRKGSYPDPRGIMHLAPRFGIIQMQRGGQKQHPEQLQFNLEAGYFYRI